MLLKYTVRKQTEEMLYVYVSLACDYKHNYFTSQLTGLPSFALDLSQTEKQRQFVKPPQSLHDPF